MGGKVIGIVNHEGHMQEGYTWRLGGGDWVTSWHATLTEDMIPHNFWVSNNKVGTVADSMEYQVEPGITNMLASMTLPSQISTGDDVKMEDAPQSKDKAKMNDERNSQKDCEGDNEMDSGPDATLSPTRLDLKRKRDSSDQGDDEREEIKKQTTDARAIRAIHLVNRLMGGNQR